MIRVFHTFFFFLLVRTAEISLAPTLNTEAAARATLDIRRDGT